MWSAAFSGPACFCAAALNQSTWLRYSGEARVREAQSAVLRSGFKLTGRRCAGQSGVRPPCYFSLPVVRPSWYRAAAVPANGRGGGCANVLSGTIKLWCAVHFIILFSFVGEATKHTWRMNVFRTLKGLLNNPISPAFHTCLWRVTRLISFYCKYVSA